MKKQPKALIITGMLLFLAGGVAWFFLAIIFTAYESLAVPVAAGLAAVGGFVLILNAVIHPESIQRPDIQPPQINLPPEIGARHRPHTAYVRTNTKTPGVINVDEWPIVRAFKSGGKPLTVRQQIRGTICCLLWIATVAIYLPLSFYLNNFEISWLMFIGAAAIHILIYSLLSIGEQKA